MWMRRRRKAQAKLVAAPRSPARKAGRDKKRAMHALAAWKIAAERQALIWIAAVNFDIDKMQSALQKHRARGSGGRHGAFNNYYFKKIEQEITRISADQDDSTSVDLGTDGHEQDDDDEQDGEGGQDDDDEQDEDNEQDGEENEDNGEGRLGMPMKHCIFPGCGKLVPMTAAYCPYSKGIRKHRTCKPPKKLRGPVQSFSSSALHKTVWPNPGGAHPRRVC